jgi:hypothetical protein
MSKRINVNPDHYKVAGRERPGDGIPAPRGNALQDDRAQERWAKKVKRQKEEGRSKD